MDWKKKSCIAATMFLLYGADAAIMPQEATAAQTVKNEQDDVQKGLDEVRILLKQGKYEEAEAICLNLLKKHEERSGTPNWELFSTLGDTYRMEEKHEEEIALWKKVYEESLQLFTGSDTKKLLLPIARLCSAYQANEDFSSTEPYLKHGEEIMKKYGEKNLNDAVKATFQKVTLFNEIGQGTIVPDEACEKAITILEKSDPDKTGDDAQPSLRINPQISERDKLELLDIVNAAKWGSPQEFSEVVSRNRRWDYTTIIRQGVNRVRMMKCLYYAALSCASNLEWYDDADLILEPMYHEIKEEYDQPQEPQMATAMIDCLSLKALISCIRGKDKETIATWGMVWKLRESAPQSKDLLENHWIWSFIVSILSYNTKNKVDEWDSKFKDLMKILDSDSYLRSYGKLFRTWIVDNPNDEELRRLVAQVREAADKECSRNPDAKPVIYTQLQFLSKMYPEMASILWINQDTSGAWMLPLEKLPLISRLMKLKEAEDAYQADNYSKAISSYESYIEAALKAGEIYGPLTMDARLHLAQSYCLAGYNARRKKFNVAAETFFENGLKEYDNLVNLYEEHREEFSDLSHSGRGKWFSSVADIYMEAVRNFYNCHPESEQKEYYNGKIFDTMEKCKARILLELYAEHIADTSGILTEEEATQLRAYQQELQTRREEIRRLEKIQEGRAIGESKALKDARREKERCAETERQYRNALQEKYPAYKTLSNPKIYSSEEAQQELLSPDTAFLGYFLRRTNSSNRKDSLYLYSLTHTSAYAEKDSIDEKEWLAYYKLLSYPDYDSFSKHHLLWKKGKDYFLQEREKEDWPVKGHAVQEQEFGAAQKELAEKWGEYFFYEFIKLGIWPGMRIIISPDDAAPPLPFETLIYKGKTFAELYEISYVPSLSVYALMKERGETNAALLDRKDLFAMGNAVYGHSGDASLDRARGDSFAELPKTAEELAQVSNLFADASKKIILQREEASESKLKEIDQRGELENYKYLLFATHGVYDADNPMTSAIVLSQPDKSKPAESDGYVTVGEWMGYHLHSDIAFLSACETGRGGTKYAGEGLVGLPYALTIAGNKSTVMTLWKIGDASAAAFSKAFFERLAQGQTASQALTETKREFLHHDIVAYRTPHVWGAFQLYGD